ncbi:C-C chemokine receptor type 4-like [Anabas testudineus]|uniref:C-C chemokine receptor type 4-like n=1 Tax=Anabas testudineus TaxID=64144 RepID=UPI000E461B7D|nr:C-C chemokine receptor type 4-like [Anabas testudineus]
MEQLTPTVVTSNISNVSSPPGRLAPACWDSRGLVPAVMLSLCFLLGVPGNAAVIILKSKWQHLSSLSQTLMLNLAASDLLCLLTLPLWTYTLLFNWIFGLVACKLLAYLVYCSIYSSLLTVTMLSVQRYLQVVYLQRCLDQRRQKRLLGLLWLVAMILSSPTLVVRQLTTDKYGTHCQSQYSDGQRVLVLLEESLIGLVCLLVVMFAYISIQIKLFILRMNAC